MPRDEALLLDMLVAARKVRRFIEGKSWEAFSTDDQLQSAVQYQIQVIGEAAFKVSRAFRETQPQIPWVGIVGLRHRLVHDYPRIELPKVWGVAQKHIPGLIAALEPLVPPDRE